MVARRILYNIYAMYMHWYTYMVYYIHMCVIKENMNICYAGHVARPREGSLLSFRSHARTPLPYRTNSNNNNNKNNNNKKRKLNKPPSLLGCTSRPSARRVCDRFPARIHSFDIFFLCLVYHMPTGRILSKIWSLFSLLFFT